ncbi:MAG: Rieske 2Fe-2S domain-containing protein [Bacteroidetes bacterium]|nr:Rieske 2Fe-2S domain-containing protein [Bacteroidota bacterium]
MGDNAIHWHKIAENAAELNWQDNHMCLVKAGDKTVTLAKHNGQLFGCAHKCPHASGILADGYINATGQITCPLHRYRFDLKNGRNTSGEGYFLTTYPVEVRPDGVYMGLKDKGFLGLW